MLMSRATPVAGRRSAASPLRHIDVLLVASVLTIAAFGCLEIFSATRRDAAGGAISTATAQRQIIFVLIGIGVMFVSAAIDYRKLAMLAPLGYIGSLLLLIGVLSPLGSAKKGTQAWYQLGAFQLQPSELVKVVLVVCMAAYAGSHRGELDARRLLIALGLAGPPLALIYLQPDLGTAFVFVAIVLGMLLVAGARPRHIAALSLLGVLGIGVVLHVGVLKQYQVERLTAFLDPAHDTQRSAYNLGQSKIAIGSGGMLGKGIFKGTQTNLSYVPEQHTDFIFTVVGEELGFAGSASLLALFAIVMWRTWRTAALSKDLYGTLVCVGVLAMLMFQVFENMGMTMGIMPITGIPLPFMSYGGSATVACFAAIGLVLNVHMRGFT